MLTNGALWRLGVHDVVPCELDGEPRWRNRFRMLRQMFDNAAESLATLWQLKQWVDIADRALLTTSNGVCMECVGKQTLHRPPWSYLEEEQIMQQSSAAARAQMRRTSLPSAS